MPFYRWSLRASRPKPGYPKELKSLGDHLKAKRVTLGVTQWAVSRELGVSEATIRNWENGNTSIEGRFYPRIIGFLGYNPLSAARSAGDAIRRERLTRGWSIKRLAEVAGIDEATVSRVERGKKGTAVRARMAVRSALGLDRD